MKPPAFDYEAPDSLDEALSLLDRGGYGAKVLAGGQSLIPTLNFRLAEPTLLIDLNGIAALDYVRADADGSLRIGAITRQRTVERHPDVVRLAPLLHEAMPHIAHPQIRNRGTLGGSIVHADPAAELPVVALALDAQFVAASLNGTRVIPATKFFFGLFMTDLQPGEILTEIVLPPPPDQTGWSFMEVARRSGDYAMMGVAARLTLAEDGRCVAARLVYLNAGPAPTDAPQAAALLVGEVFSNDLAEAAADKAATDEIEPMGSVHASVAYQRHLARVLTRRALTTAYSRAQEGRPA